MVGLPYSVTEGDIVEFFHGFGLIEESIKIGKYSNGKTTGEAFVLFENG
jgi:RNA recognition motif-containing protein